MAPKTCKHRRSCYRNIRELFPSRLIESSDWGSCPRFPTGHPILISLRVADGQLIEEIIFSKFHARLTGSSLEVDDRRNLHGPPGRFRYQRHGYNLTSKEELYTIESLYPAGHHHRQASRKVVLNGGRAREQRTTCSGN